MLSLAAKASLGFLGLAHAVSAQSYSASFAPNTQDLFQESMTWLDQFYDPETGYLHDESEMTALRHETRSSVWYAVGCLARNQRDDVAKAEKIITNTINAQYRVPSAQW
jgi:hypothetical protein